MQDSYASEPSVRTRRVVNALVIILIVGLFAIGIAAYLSQRESWRNVERLKDVQAITNALHQYAASHGGDYPAGIDTRAKQIGSATTKCEVRTAQCSISVANDCVDLAPALTPYLKDMPNDPGRGNEEWTRYAVKLERSGGFLVVACDYSE